MEIFTIIMFVIDRSLVLRGDREVLGIPANQNILGQVELMLSTIRWLIPLDELLSQADLFPI